MDEIDLKCHTTSQPAFKYPLIYGCINGAHLKDKHDNSDQQVIIDCKLQQPNILEHGPMQEIQTLRKKLTWAKSEFTCSIK